MRFADLTSWLRWQETLHPSAIDLGLERVAAVWSRMCTAAVPFPVITVAGTNGKGSCAAMLESIYRAAGYRTACYTSPHLLLYNERLRVDGQEVTDAALCAAFERVDQARADTTLTYFEFGTLAALDLFVRARPDLTILEVGLGGRLDAVNILDPDVAVITTIGLDHTAWLGETLDEIAIEKAGILRAGQPAVIGHRTPSPALLERAATLECSLFILGRDFDWMNEGSGWRWTGPGLEWAGLPPLPLHGAFQRDNAATALMALSCLGPGLGTARYSGQDSSLHLSLDDLRRGLEQVRLTGRFQILPGEVAWILDVAHNGQAAQALAANLRAFGCRGRLHGVLGVLQDKDPRAIAAPLAELVHRWYLGQAAGPRALPTSKLVAKLAGIATDSNSSDFPTIEAALEAASAQARPGDCILAFGSFTTIESALQETCNPHRIASSHAYPTP